MSFTVPLNGCTIVATATVVISCSSSADCPGSVASMCCLGVCVAITLGLGVRLEALIDETLFLTEIHA